MAAVNDEIMALGLAADGFINGGIEKVIALRSAQGLAQVGRIFLANVGANASHRFSSPIFEDGSFEVLPIPEARSVAEGPGASLVRYGMLRSYNHPEEDLRRNRENGWALFGLMQALGAQGKSADAALTEARFKKAWARADVTLTASRFSR